MLLSFINRLQSLSLNQYFVWCQHFVILHLVDAIRENMTTQYCHLEIQQSQPQFTNAFAAFTAYCQYINFLCCQTRPLPALSAKNGRPRQNATAQRDRRMRVSRPRTRRTDRVDSGRYSLKTFFRVKIVQLMSEQLDLKSEQLDLISRSREEEMKEE